MNRRDAFRTGLAGFGAVVSAGTAHAAMSRVDDSMFGYQFRTFKQNETIRVGMVGTDGHVATVLGSIGSGTGTTLVAYANRANTSLNLPRGVKLYNDYEEMFDREKLDVVGVCMPYHRNAEVSVAAAERGLHIISEKPVATTLDDLAKLLATVVHNRVRLTTMLEMRLHPPFKAVHDAVAAGMIGEPVLATAQKSYKFGESRPEFYKNLETYGGTIPWVGIHAIDFIKFGAGMGFRRVAAFHGNAAHPDYPGCQDHAGVLLAFENGGTAMVNMDYQRPDKAPTHGDDRLRIIGTEGVVEVKDLAMRVELITHSREPVDLELPEPEPFFVDFVRELRGGEPHVLTAADAFEMTRVSLVARNAALDGRIMAL